MAQGSPYRIDNETPSVYELLGHDKIVALSTAFYTRVYNDKDDWFRSMFHSSIENAIQDQYEFLIQRFGGPDLYSNRKGHPALRMRHVKFHIERRGADRWLQYMNEALDEVKIEGDLKTKMFEFFNDVAYFLQNVNEDGSRIYGPPVQKK